MNFDLFALCLSKAIRKNCLLQIYRQKNQKGESSSKLNYSNLLNCSSAQLSDKGFIKKNKFFEGRENIFKNAEKVLKKCQQQDTQIVTIEDNDYPFLLKQIYDPPLVLYYKGILPKLRPNQENLWGIVGTRKSDFFIDDYVRNFSREIISKNGCVISGMALGVDTAAHEGAVLEMAKNNSKNFKGTTIAVLANGVDIIYPYQNKNLYHKILEYGGCILSEQEIEQSPSKYSFPLRNRIIAGLSQNIFLAKAPKKSGAIITVKAGLDMGKTIYTYLPKEYSEDYQGNFDFIEQGASILNTQNKECHYQDNNFDNEYDQNIVNLLNEEKSPIRIQDISKKTKEKDIFKLNRRLTSLQLRGFIKQLPSKKYYSVSFLQR